MTWKRNTRKYVLKYFSLVAERKRNKTTSYKRRVHNKRIRKWKAGGVGVEERKIKAEPPPYFFIFHKLGRTFYKGEKKQRNMQIFVHFKCILKQDCTVATLRRSGAWFWYTCAVVPRKMMCRMGGSQVPPKLRYSSTILNGVTHPKIAIWCSTRKKIVLWHRPFKLCHLKEHLRTKLTIFT